MPLVCPIQGFRSFGLQSGLVNHITRGHGVSLPDAYAGLGGAGPTGGLQFRARQKRKAPEPPPPLHDDDRYDEPPGPPGDEDSSSDEEEGILDSFSTRTDALLASLVMRLDMSVADMGMLLGAL